MSGSQRLAGLVDARALRARWLAASTRLVEGYLRSPLFLLWMRCGLAAAAHARSLYSSGGVARRAPAAERAAPQRP